MSEKKMQNAAQQAFQGRLRRLVEKAGGNNQFALKCGISQGGISGYLKGADPSRANLIAMAQAANVSLQYLATGVQTAQDIDGFYPVRVALLDPVEPLVWVAGPAKLYIEKEIVETFRGADGRNLVMVRCNDDAMQPRIYRGEWTIVDATSDNADDGIYALIIGGRFKIRSLAILADGDVNVYDCRKGMKPRTYSRDTFRGVKIVGRVVVSGRYPDVDGVIRPSTVKRRAKS